MKPATKDGRPIHPHVFAQLEAIGRQLEARGYVERGRRPNLFVHDYRSVQFYADFGGTPEVAPWENTAPLFYWFFRKPLDLETRQAMVLIEWRRLAGVPKRISWNIKLGHGEGDAEAEAVFIDDTDRDDVIRLPDRPWTAHRYVLAPESREQLL